MVDFINRRHGILTATLFIGFVFAVALRGQNAAPSGIWLVCGAVGFLGVLWAAAVDMQTPEPAKIAQSAAQPSESARLIADCEFQHAAWQRGDWELAMYGRFQP